MVTRGAKHHCKRSWQRTVFGCLNTVANLADPKLRTKLLDAILTVFALTFELDLITYLHSISPLLVVRRSLV